MGFDPELTGRQNAKHSAGLMGFSAEEIDGVILAIEDFAEIGAYFDESIRTYSSGMQMRVAFAVATAFRPDILIVDEALSVGDAYFQHKSFSKIKEFQELGTTLLIVSHDKNAIQSMCDRAILLDQGTVAKDGSPEEVFDYYNALIAKKENSNIQLSITDDGKVRTSSGTGEASIETVLIYNKTQQETDTLLVSEQASLKVTVNIHEKIDTLVMGYAIKDRLGQVCYGTNTWYSGQMLEQPIPGNQYEFNIQFPANFGVGSYSVSIALHDNETHLTKNYDWQELALIFNVINADKASFQGNNWLDQTITITECQREKLSS